MNEKFVKTVIFSEKNFGPKTHLWKFTYLGKDILQMPIDFEHDRMKNEWEIRKNGQFFRNKKFWTIFGPRNIFDFFKQSAFTEAEWMIVGNSWLYVS